MPYIMTFVWYPLPMIKKALERYYEATKELPIPPIIKRVVLAATASNREGIEVINVDEVKTEDLGEANNYLSKFMLKFRDLEGVNFKIRSYSTLSEGVKNLGMWLESLIILYISNILFFSILVFFH